MAARGYIKEEDKGRLKSWKSRRHCCVSWYEWICVVAEECGRVRELGGHYL